jgi:ribosome-interacting GTPase 1
MPTNLPPEYFEADRRYREASDPLEKVARLEELISTIPKHKGTDKLRADLRRKLSKMKDSAQTRKKTGRRDPAWYIEKEGAGMVVVIGVSNTGKSALVRALTNAEPEVSPAAHNTWQPTPGMMLVDNVQIQLIDTPSLDRDFIEPALMDLVRRADLVLLLVDLTTDPNQQLQDSLSQLEEHRIEPVVEADGRPKTLIAPILVVANKCDDKESEENLEIFQRLMEGDWPVQAVSVETGRGLVELGRAVFDRLNIMRIYSKAPGKEPDLGAPFVIKAGSSVEQFAREIHHDFYDNLKSARVWGHGVHDGQLVAREHVLHDEDVVELRA